MITDGVHVGDRGGNEVIADGWHVDFRADQPQQQQQAQVAAAGEN